MRRYLALATAAALLASAGLAAGASDLGDSAWQRLPVTGGPIDSSAVQSAARPAARMRQRPGTSMPLGAGIRRTTVLRATPGGAALARVGPTTVFDGPQILAVVARRGRWLGVLHEAVPNGKAGWIRARDARLYSEPWQVTVDRSERMAVVRHRGRLVRRFTVGVGAGGSPTPVGRFAVTDRLLTGGRGSVYGCCILALSGRQTQLPAGWRGGDRLALHGASDERRVGAATSAGCLVVRGTDMRWLLRRVPVGTRVDIRA